MFPSIFDRPDIWYRRPFYENVGYKIQEKDGKLFLYVSVLGLGKDDLEINTEPAENPNHMFITIKGEKKYDDENSFRVSNKFYLHKLPEEISPTVENGLLILEIKFKEPVRPDVKINWKNNR